MLPISIPTIFNISIEVYIILLIIGVPVYLLTRWLMRNRLKSQRNSSILTWVVTLIATPLIYLTFVLLLVYSVSYHPKDDFDKHRWMADKEKRYELSEDVIESKILIGKTKAEVRSILGDEDNTDDSNYWTYYLGYRPTIFGIDPDVLDIEFQDGRVVKVGQHQT